MIDPIDRFALMRDIKCGIPNEKQNYCFPCNMIIKAIENAPTIATEKDGREIEELRARIDFLQRKHEIMKGEIKALMFALRCNSVSGSEISGNDLCL